ncbi:MAG: Rieske 2Fe-2S domain-containing protein [Terriglobia bacterium]|jgi:cytochrome b6-f complex iron-sulfur subunit
MANAGDAATPTPIKAPVSAVATPPKPAPKAASSKGKPAVEEISPSAKLRRRIIWSCIWGFVAANLLMFLRFFFPRALFEPSTVFKIGYPSDFQPGVDERFKAQARIWVVREADRIFVIFGRCTHLGCTPDWKPAEHKFKCPCHGSGYTPEGINFEGPAPRPMDRAHVELDATGQIIVDTSRLYSWPKGGVDHFNDPGSFVNV